MPMLQTMGTHSCAAIAIGGFKSKYGGYSEPIEDNEKYLKDKSLGDSLIRKLDEGMTVQQFYDKILYPIEQELGRTHIYTFDHLMDLIDKHHTMNRKFTILSLNASQNNYQDGYWPKRLEARGFNLAHKTRNSIGGALNYIYIRDLAKAD